MTPWITSTVQIATPRSVPLGRVQRTPVATASGTTLSVVFSSPPTIGNAIIVAASGKHITNVITTCVDNKGNTYNLAFAPTGNAGGPCGVAFWLCPAIIATGASFTITITGANVPRLLVAIEVSGVGVGLLLDQTKGNTTGVSGTTTGSTATLTSAESFVVTGVSVGAAIGALNIAAATPSWIEEAEVLAGGNPAGEIDSRIVSTTAAQSASWTWSGGAFAASAIATFKAGAPLPITVPNVIGLPEAAASSALTAAGLTTGTVTTGASETVEAGRVLSQSPTAGASVPPGTAVNLVLSLGPTGPGPLIKIAGVDRSLVLDALSISMPLNDRTKASATLYNTLPLRHQEVVTYRKDGVTPMFGGIVLMRSYTGLTHNDPDYQITLDCGDYFSFLDWRMATLAYPAPVTLKTVLNDLVANYLNVYGITVDPAQADGPLLTAFTWTAKRISDGIRELSDKTGYVARISATKKLRMLLPGTEAAPFSVTEAQTNVMELSWKDNDRAFANTVTVIGGPTGQAEVHDERHYGDGVKRIFPLNAPFVAIIGALSIYSEGAGGYPVATCGVHSPPGESGDYPYCYNPANNSIQQRADQPVIMPGDYFWIWYVAQFPFTVTETSIPPGDTTTLVIEQVEVREDVMSIPVAREIAIGLLGQVSSTPREITLTTDVDGLEPGQALLVNLPTTRSIVGTFVITSVNMHIELDTDQGDKHWVYQAEAIDSSVYQGNYLDQWRKMTGGGGGSSSGVGVISGGGGDGGEGGVTGPLAPFFFLGGSRLVSVYATPAAWLPVPNYVPFTATNSFSGQVRADIMALHAGVSVQARLFNLTDALAVATSEVVTSTTAVSIAMIGVIDAGKTYRLEVLSSLPDEGVFGIGTLEVA